MVGSLTAHRGYKAHHYIATMVVTLSGPPLPVMTKASPEVVETCSVGLFGGGGGVGSKVFTLS